jgi:hypothetical protein
MLIMINNSRKINVIKVGSQLRNRAAYCTVSAYGHISMAGLWYHIPCDSGGCNSVTRIYPNPSEARPMSLRYEQRKEENVDDLQ